jgi:hypothetical protein
VVRIEPLDGPPRRVDPARATSRTTAVMVVRLDEPLSYDHTADDEDVIPVRVIRARRFAGHACQLPIDRVDPAHDGVAAIANFSSSQALAEGLSLHLTIEASEGHPRVTRGDGWHFAARSDGWFETRLFAPVEDPAPSDVTLAQLTVTPDRYELLDLRPLPAALAVDDELARISAAAATIASLLADDPAVPLLREVKHLAGAPRVQPALVRKLHELARIQQSRLYMGPVRRSWLERLDQAVGSVAAAETPTRRQLATMAFAISGLAFAFAAEHPSRPTAHPSPPPPAGAAASTTAPADPTRKPRP